jgi:hypothetical protein
MPFCPACRSEYRAGFVRCADCGATLVETLPSAPAPIATPVEDVQLATFATVLEAEMWAERLRGEGIPVILLGSGREWTEFSAVWPPALRVRASDAERARDILLDR